MNHLKKFESWDDEDEPVGKSILDDEDRQYVEDCLSSIVEDWNLRKFQSGREYTTVSKSVPDPTSDEKVFTGEYLLTRNSRTSLRLSITMPFFAKGPVSDQFLRHLEFFRKRIRSRGMYCYSGNKTGKREWSWNRRFGIMYRGNSVPIREWEIWIRK